MMFGSAIDVGLFLQRIISEEIENARVVLINAAGDFMQLKVPFVGIYATGGRIVRDVEMDIEKIEFVCLTGCENLRGDGAGAFGKIKPGALQIVEFVRRAIDKQTIPNGNLRNLQIDRWEVVDVKKGVVTVRINILAELLKFRNTGREYEGDYFN